MKTTRMKMTKEAAALIHEYRDEHCHKTNSDAVYGLISDLDVANCNEVFMSKQIAELESEKTKLDRGYRTLKCNLAMKTERLEQIESSLQVTKDSLSRERELVKALRSDRKWGLDQISELEKQVEKIESFRMMWKGAATAGWATLLMVCAGMLAHMIITP